MYNMRNVLLLVLTLMSCQWCPAQDMTRFWAVGTAVPGGIQELTPFPNRQFK